MTERLLEVVRAEISEHETAIAKLREVERLVLELTAGPQPKTERAPDPARPKPLPQQRRGTSHGSAPRRERTAVAQRKQAILEAPSARGALGPRAIAEAIGEPVSSIAGDLRQLLAEAKLVAHGATNSRTYDVARNGSDSTPVAQERDGERPLEQALLDAAGVDSL